MDGHFCAVFGDPGLNAVRAGDRLAVGVFQDDLNQGRMLGKDVRGMRDVPEAAAMTLQEPHRPLIDEADREVGKCFRRPAPGTFLAFVPIFGYRPSPSGRGLS